MTLEVLRIQQEQVIAVGSDTGHQDRANLPPIVPLIMDCSFPFAVFYLYDLLWPLTLHLNSIVSCISSISLKVVL